MNQESDSKSPYSPALVQLLQTIIAPGGRARLSPLIEAAQFKVLFDERFDSRHRQDSVRRILRTHRQDIDTLAKRWVDFVELGKKFHADIYDWEFLRAYLAYYLTTNVCKLQLSLLELVRQGRLSGSLTLADVGVGSGTTAIAALDFFLAYAYACNLREAYFPIQSIRLIGWDANEHCLKFAAHMVQAYAATLEERVELSPHDSADILTQVWGWAQEAQWEKCDLNKSPLLMPEGKTLLVISNVRNELEKTGKHHIDQAIMQLSPGSMVVIIEPGDERSTKTLNKWRREILNDNQHNQTLISLAHCGQEYGGQLPQQCEDCWNARRESLHPPMLYKHFCKSAHALLKDNRRFGDYENDLLSWSLTCLLRSEDKLPPVTFPSRLNIGVNDKIESRYIGTFLQNQPFSCSPDEMDNKPDLIA